MIFGLVFSIVKQRSVRLNCKCNIGRTVKGHFCVLIADVRHEEEIILDIRKKIFECIA